MTTRIKIRTYCKDYNNRDYKRSLSNRPAVSLGGNEISIGCSPYSNKERRSTYTEKNPHRYLTERKLIKQASYFLL